MRSSSKLAPASAASPFECWYWYFADKQPGLDGLLRNDSYLLNAAERRLVARSIQQFQLGEWARGRGLMRRASSHPLLAADPWFLPALELFIAEEQVHSGMLERFLDHQGIPRLSNNWLDTIFRRLRKLAGLEVCVMVLVTAEVLAMPFYQALRDATRSQFLRSICWRILCDEAAHLRYQALTLGLLRRPLGDRARRIRSLCHCALFHGTALLLWQQHRRVFRAAEWGFRRFWKESRREFGRLQRRIRQVSVHRERMDSFSELRLID